MSSYRLTFPLIILLNICIYINGSKTENVCSRGQSADQSRIGNPL